MTISRHIANFILVIVLILTILFIFKSQKKTVHRSYSSPDKKFKLVVYSYWRLIATPGSGSDAKGLLCLYDERTGKELERCKVDIVQEVDQIEWSSTNVCVKLIADWPLPK